MFLINAKKYRKKEVVSENAGFTLIEALTVLFIFSLITTTFYSVFTLGSGYIIESKNRLGAVSLANEKMEIIRNLQYDSIGITGGIPSGSIPEDEDVVENKHAYHVKTFVQYVDDPFDGVLPSDIIFNDYKRVKVTVSWGGAGGGESSYSLTARFVPPGIEQSIAGGILSINIIGSDGIGVPQSSVHITNSSVSPAVDVTVKTDDSGNIMLPGAKESSLGYHMKITKDGYETVGTIDEESVTYSVIDVPASVVDGMLNVKTIIQDEVIDLTFNSSDYYGTRLEGIGFGLIGGRILGNDLLSSPAEPVYNVDGTYQTDSNGEKKLEGISPGEFFVSEITIPEGYTLIGMDNFDNFDHLTGQYGFVASPGEERINNIKIAEDAVNSVLVSAANSADGNRLNGATVTLSNTSGYNESMTTLPDGVAFFPLSNETGMEIGTYNLKIEAENYQEYNAEIEVVNGLVEHQANLTVN